MYLYKVYSCEMYPTCVSSKLCEFIFFPFSAQFWISFNMRMIWKYHLLENDIFGLYKIPLKVKRAMPVNGVFVERDWGGHVTVEQTAYHQYIVLYYCILCNVYCILYIVYCILYIVYCILVWGPSGLSDFVRSGCVTQNLTHMLTCVRSP